MKQRLYYIDNLKGILILLVILGHCIQFTTADFDHHPIFRFIYSFHMPLFMAVSGYVSYKAELKWESLSRRFMQLVVPFLAWAAISMLAKADPGYLLTTLLQPDMGLWFLWVLFAISALLTACHRLASRLNIRTELTAAALTPLMLGCVVVFGLSLFGAHLIAWYFIFYCMGFFFRKYESAGFSMSVMASVASLLIFIALLPFWMRTEPPTFLHGRGGIIANYAYKFVTAFFAMFAIIPLAKRMLDYKLLAVSKLGGATLGIYAIHQPLIGAIVAIAVSLGVAAVDSPLFIAGLFVAATLISCAIYYILDRWHVTAMLFLGKARKPAPKCAPPAPTA